jgi:hypothetical protein
VGEAAADRRGRGRSVGAVAQDARAIIGAVAKTALYGGKRTYPRSPKRPYDARALLNRGRRRSRRLMTEPSRGGHIAVAVKPREAQRPTSLAARTPKAATPGDGDIAVDVMAGREVRPAGSSPAVQGRRSALAPPGAPSPHLGNKENRDTGQPGARKTRSPAGEALAGIRTGVLHSEWCRQGKQAWPASLKEKWPSSPARAAASAAPSQ